MLKKAFTPAKLLLEGLSLLACGIWMLASPVAALKAATAMLRWIFFGAGAVLALQGLLDREKRPQLAKGAILMLASVALACWPQWIGTSVSMIFGLWVALNALFKLIYTVQLARGRQKGFWFSLLTTALHTGFSAFLLMHPLTGLLPMTAVMGVYLIVYGLFSLGDCLRELLRTDIRGRSVKRRIRIAPPVLLTALTPMALLRALDDPDEAEETAKWTRRETTDDGATADLEIFVHLSKSTAMGMGHVDIALGDRVLAYGCYDPESNRLFGAISDGVLVEADRRRYIPFCLEHEKKKLIGFGVSLTQEQKKLVADAAEGFLRGSVLWEPAAGTESALLAQQAGAVFHKLRQGPFATYNVFKTNCVALADWLCGASGLDLMVTQGVITPGTYFTFLDRQFRRPNSIVISRTVYR